jgi:hypothetical protein
MLGGMILTRRHLLYIMLGALGVGALSGVVALLTGDGGTVWRVAGTSFAAAISAAIMFPMAGWADKPATRTAGLLGMSVAVVELLLASVLIWGESLGWPMREFLGWSAAIVGIGGLVSARFLKDIGMPERHWTSRVGCAAAALASGLFLIAAGIESFYSAWSEAGKFAGTAWSTFVTGFICAIALVGWQRPDRRWWRWIGVGAAAVALGLTNYGIWIHSGGEPAWVVGAYSIAAVVAHAIACLRLSLSSGQGIVRVVAMGAAACTGLLSTMSAAIHTSWDRYGGFDWEWRASAAFMLITVSATLALVVIGRLNRRPVVELSRTASFDKVSLVCPRCSQRLELPVGGALCSGCKLHITVTIHTARCAKCNYELENLKAERCPECGEPIPAGSTGLGEAT